MKIASNKKIRSSDVLMRNLATSLILYESIKTSKIRAMKLSSFIDRVIRMAKNNDLHSKKYVHSIVYDKNAYKKLYDEIIPRYNNRSSGYTRKYKIANRKGDNCNQIIIELIGKKEYLEKKNIKDNKVTDIKNEIKK